MKASGANATPKHLEEVSMSALLLMDTAKRVDDMFGVQQSNVHTIRDAKHDIEKIMSYLLSERVDKYNPSREGDQFHDPRIAGWAKVAKGYLDSYLKGEIEAEEQMQDNSNDGNIDFNYELYLVE